MDDHFIGQLFRFGNDLAATGQVELFIAHQFESPAVAVQREACRCEIEGHRLQAAFKHESPRHAGIVLKVTFETAAFFTNSRAGLQVASSIATSVEVEFSHFVEQALWRTGDRRRPHVRSDEFVLRSEATDHVSEVERFQLRIGIARRDIRNRKLRAMSGRSRRGVCLINDGSRRVAKFFIGEEARLAIAHGQSQFAIHPAVVMEEEEPHVTLPRVSVDHDLITERVARTRWLAEVLQATAEQAIDAPILVEEVRSHPRNQHEVRLPRFDHRP